MEEIRFIFQMLALMMKKALLRRGRQKLGTDILLLRDKSCGRTTGEAVRIIIKGNGPPRKP